MEEKKQDVKVESVNDSATNDNYIKLSKSEYESLIRENATLKKDIEFNNTSSIKVVSHSNENKQTEEKPKRRLF